MLWQIFLQAIQMIFVLCFIVPEPRAHIKQHTYYGRGVLEMRGPAVALTGRHALGCKDSITGSAKATQSKLYLVPSLSKNGHHGRNRTALRGLKTTKPAFLSSSSEHLEAATCWPMTTACRGYFSKALEPFRVHLAFFVEVCSIWSRPQCNLVAAVIRLRLA